MLKLLVGVYCLVTDDLLALALIGLVVMRVVGDDGGTKHLEDHLCGSELPGLHRPVDLPPLGLLHQGYVLTAGVRGAE